MEEISSKGAMQVCCAVVDNAVGIFPNNISFFTVDKVYQDRIKFIKEGRLLKMLVDAMGYDYEKFRDACLRKINVEYQKANRLLQQRHNMFN